jgi:hypothetical protein
LPPSKLDHRRRISGIKVGSSSTIQVRRNTYSVPSRLIGMQVDIVIDADEIEVWRAGTKVQTMPRLSGDGKHAINYRHVIDSLVRKPGALENYQYHADMFPTSHFRMAYDQLLGDHSVRVAAREYLKILQLAARDSQDAVQDALRLAIKENEPITAELIRAAVERHQQAPPVAVKVKCRQEAERCRTARNAANPKTLSTKPSPLIERSHAKMVIAFSFVSLLRLVRPDAVTLLVKGQLHGSSALPRRLARSSLQRTSSGRESMPNARPCAAVALGGKNIFRLPHDA